MHKKTILNIFFMITSGIGIFLMPIVITITNNNKSQTIKYKTTIDSLKSVENKRILMTYTLNTAYNISLYEAYTYAVIMDKFAQCYNSDWTLYAAIVKTESNFNPRAYSEYHAIGLMQILEKTAEKEAEQLNINYKTNETLYNVILNLTIGCSYLSRHLVKGENYAIKTYVGGPTFSESSSYVKKYHQSILQERKKLKYIYKGVLYDYSNKSLKLPDMMENIKKDK